MRPITPYIMTEGTSLDDVVASPHELESRPLTIDGLDATIFVGASRAFWWTEILDELSAGTLAELLRRPTGAVLALDIDDISTRTRVVCLAFGTGRHLLAQDEIEHSMPNMFTILHDSLRSESLIMPPDEDHSGSSVHDIHDLGRFLAAFARLVLLDYLSSAPVRDFDEGYRDAPGGERTVRVASDAESRELTDILVERLEQLPYEPYESTVPSTSDRTEQYEYSGPTVSLDIPSPFDSEDIIEVGLLTDHLSLPNDEQALQGLLSLASLHLGFRSFFDLEPDRTALFRLKTWATYRFGSFLIRVHAPFYRCLSAVVVQKDVVFQLHDGVWSRYTRQYLDAIRRGLRPIVNSGKSFPDHKRFEPEKKYNQRASDKMGALCLDRVPVHVSVGRHWLELCDILFHDHSLTHTKKSGCVRDISHLLAQAQGAIEMFVNTGQFRWTAYTSVRHIDSNFCHVVSPSHPPSAFTVILLILGVPSQRNVLDAMAPLNLLSLNRAKLFLDHLGVACKLDGVPTA